MTDKTIIVIAFITLTVIILSVAKRTGDLTKRVTILESKK